MMFRFFHPKRKLENNSCSSSRKSRSFRSIQIRRMFNNSPGAGDIEMESSNFETFNPNEETESFQLGSDDDMIEEDEDLHWQQMLFQSAQFHSGKNLDSRYDHASGKEVVESQHFYSSGVKGIREKGESSCIFCAICNDAFPPNTMLEGGSCQHYFCEDCIISYVGEKIKDNIHRVECPVKSCKQVLDLELLMPYDFLARVEDATREARVLAEPLVIPCPFWRDCMGKLIDDRKGYLIRACPECWRIFCMRCRNCWHMGMTCEAYAYMVHTRANYFYSQLGGNGAEQEQEDERGNSMTRNYF